MPATNHDPPLAPEGATLRLRWNAPSWRAPDHTSALAIDPLARGVWCVVGHRYAALMPLSTAPEIARIDLGACSHEPFVVGDHLWARVEDAIVSWSLATATPGPSFAIPPTRMRAIAIEPTTRRVLFAYPQHGTSPRSVSLFDPELSASDLSPLPIELAIPLTLTPHAVYGHGARLDDGSIPIICVTLPDRSVREITRVPECREVLVDEKGAQVLIRGWRGEWWSTPLAGAPGAILAPETFEDGIHRVPVLADDASLWLLATHRLERWCARDLERLEAFQVTGADPLAGPALVCPETRQLIAFEHTHRAGCWNLDEPSPTVTQPSTTIPDDIAFGADGAHLIFDGTAITQSGERRGVSWLLAADGAHVELGEDDARPERHPPRQGGQTARSVAGAFSIERRHALVSDGFYNHDDALEVSIRSRDEDRAILIGTFDERDEAFALCHLNAEGVCIYRTGARVRRAVWPASPEASLSREEITANAREVVALEHSPLSLLVLERHPGRLMLLVFDESSHSHTTQVIAETSEGTIQDVNMDRAGVLTGWGVSLQVHAPSRQHAHEWTLPSPLLAARSHPSRRDVALVMRSGEVQWWAIE